MKPLSDIFLCRFEKLSGIMGTQSKTVRCKGIKSVKCLLHSHVPAVFQALEYLTVVDEFL